MKRCLLILAGGLFSVTGIGLETVVSDEVIDELLVTTCVDCHDSDTDTGFDITRLPFEMTEDNQLYFCRRLMLQRLLFSVLPWSTRCTN